MNRYDDCSFPDSWKVEVHYNRIKDLNQKSYELARKEFQYFVPDTIWARGFPRLKVCNS